MSTSIEFAEMTWREKVTIKVVVLFNFTDSAGLGVFPKL